MYSWEKRAESAPSLYLWKARKDWPALEMDGQGKSGETGGGESRKAAVLERSGGGGYEREKTEQKRLARSGSLLDTVL